MRPTLSISMIVKNEEAFLDECLKSVREVADDIVIVDTGSTDRTKEIALRWDARVYDYEWNGDFAAARNFSLRHCTGDWVLYIDADERLTAESARVLPRLIAQENADAFMVTIENPQTMRQGMFHQQNAYPRLFRRLPGVGFEGRVHEQVWQSLKRLKLTVQPSPLTILHLGYSRGYDVVKEKAERNLQLLRKQLEDHPDDGYAWFQMGNSLVVLQRYDEAKSAIEEALRQSHLDASIRASCYNLLAEVAVRSGKLPDAVSLCMKSLEIAPSQLMAQWFLSLLYFDLHEYEKAIGVLKRILVLIKKSQTERAACISSDLHLTTEDVHRRLALTYEAASRYSEALDDYIWVLKRVPADEGALQGFLRCVEKVDNSRTAIEKLKAAVRVAPQRYEFFLPLARHHRSVGDSEGAFGYLEKAIEAEPANGNLYALAVRWRMESGKMDEADRLIAVAEEKQIRAFDLHKVALQVALAKGDIHSAFRHLELMAQTSDADLTPLRNRLSALAAKLSSHATP